MSRDQKEVSVCMNMILTRFGVRMRVCDSVCIESWYVRVCLSHLTYLSTRLCLVTDKK